MNNSIEQIQTEVLKQMSSDIIFDNPTDELMVRNAVKLTVRIIIKEIIEECNSMSNDYSNFFLNNELNEGFDDSEKGYYEGLLVIRDWIKQKYLGEEK